MLRYNYERMNALSIYILAKENGKVADVKTCHVLIASCDENSPSILIL